MRRRAFHVLFLRKTGLASRLSSLPSRLSSLLARVALLGLLLLSAPHFSRPAWAQDGASVGEHSTPIGASPEKREQEVDENDAYRHSKAVAKLGSIVGMNADQAATVFTILNFLVLAALLGYFALKLLPAKFRERSLLIQRQLVEARGATEEASARLKGIEDRLGRLDGEIATMRQQLEAETAREERKIEASVAEEAAKIVVAAEADILAATTAARRDLQKHAAELAIQYAAQRLVVTAETDRRLIQGFAQQLAGEKGGQN